MHIRRISIGLRRLQSAKEGKRILQNFEAWRAPQRRLAPANPSERTLLIIRLDDIGDYLLFRNQLPMYKRSPRWQDHRITLLGNDSWRDLFTAFDHDAVDDVLWVNKSRYLVSAEYRWEIWERLRARGVEAVVAPSRTRPLVLDDLCMLAAAPRHTLGSINTYVHARWNERSDALYDTLFRPSDAVRRLHEFQFNARFTAWACGISDEGARPRIDARFPAPMPEPYILCFVGANTRSKRWPAQRWIEFIELYRRHYSGQVMLAGHSAAELRTVKTIQQCTDAESIAGKVTLTELTAWTAAARAVVTNDTMAAHLGVALDRPTLIIANGVNYERFTEYRAAGIGNTVTLYPQVFNRRRRRTADLVYHYADALSADIASIRGRTAFDTLQDLLTPTLSPVYCASSPLSTR